MMPTITGISTAQTAAQPLFVNCHVTPFLDQEGKERTLSVHVKLPPISDDEETHVVPSDIESEYDNVDEEQSIDADASMSERDDTCDNIVISDVTSIRTEDFLPDVGSNDSSTNMQSENIVKTVLVPVRDPVTRQLRNVLVPVEVKDDTGMNIIKSILVPVQDEDGLMSYQIKKVIVPIKRELNLPEKKPKALPRNEASKPKKKGRKAKDRKNGEKETEKKKAVKGVEDKKGESKIEESVKEEAVLKTEKEEVDLILENVKNICPYCQKSFEDEIQVSRHVRRNHKKPFRCKICYNYYFSKESLEEHMKSHGGDTYLECPFCHQRYKRMIGLRYHQIRAHSTIEPKFACDQCGKCFKLKHDLSSHIERTHAFETHICRFCGKSVRNINQHEWLHEKAAKKVVFPFSCHLCPSKFKRQTGLDNHLLVHRNSIKCDQCCKAFMSNCELEDHKNHTEDHKINHAEAKTFVCKYCHNAYSQKSCLVAHKLLVHGIQIRVPKEFQCNICTKSFATEHSLNKHVSLHSKLFACTHCGKEFTSSHNLKLHMRKHTGERPYECKVCNRSFARSNALRVHRLTHTGERPYVCDLCGQSFTQRSSMMAHRRRHPGSHPPPPPLLLSKLEVNENEF